MKNLYEILKVVLPAIIAGLFTFLHGKYTYNKNIPLDKLEITYNRVYYPLYKIILNNNDINTIINKSKIYFLKYAKYIDISTIRLFNSLCECDNKTKRKSIYQSLKDNIYNRNSYLRRRLGYLEPDFIQLYKYSTPSVKSLFRIIIGVCILYISLISCGITMNNLNTIFIISAAIFIVSILWIMCELIWCFLRFLYYKIRK